MIKLDRSDRRTRFFLWCLRNPMCRAHMVSAEGIDQGLKSVEWYVENGTTLCHFFWCCLWAPLIQVGVASLCVFLVGFFHVQAYETYGAVGLFLPTGVVLIPVAFVAMVILAFIGAGKAGLLAYLIALKQKICPRITFD
jgi:hypothetical protein